MNEIRSIFDYLTNMSYAKLTLYDGGVTEGEILRLDSQEVVLFDEISGMIWEVDYASIESALAY